VERESFIKVLSHYSDSSVKDAEEVLSLKEAFPYSQLLHALAARLSKDHGFSNQQTELQLAAIYAADRGVLKEVMTGASMLVLKPVEKVSETSVQKAAVPSETLSKKEPVSIISTAKEDVADAVIHDLERLHELKHNFEMLFVDAEKVAGKPANIQPPVRKPEVSVPNEEPTASVKESGKSKKERIIEMAKALQAEKNDGADQPKTEPKSRKKKNTGEDLINEIVSSKVEIQPESEKQKEQLEIIDQFIKTQPSISNTKDKPIAAPEGDLAVIKSGEFGDNIVSETLVDILIKQGKKDKAIEVLKKLIWKFPQKKAYFAAQIEDLKK